MIHIVCPYCHTPLSTPELETAILEGHACLVCPECEHILVTDVDEDHPTIPHDTAIHA